MDSNQAFKLSSRCRLILVLQFAFFLSACQSSITHLVEYQRLPSHSITTVNEGSVESVRIEVRAGDCFVTADCHTARERVELTTVKSPDVDMFSNGMERWYRFQLKFPEDWHTSSTVGGITVAQVKMGGVSHPVFRLDVGPRNKGISHDWLTASLWHSWKWMPWDSSKGDRISKLLKIDDIKGEWGDFVLHAKWSKNDDGFAYLYLNGKPIWSQLGANVAKGSNTKIYQKTGIYRFDASGVENPDTSVIFVRAPTKSRSQSGLKLPYDLTPFNVKQS